MSNPLPETLFLRLSGNALHMARYDADNPTNFAYSAYRLNPQISLAANLREADAPKNSWQAPLRGMVQVLVDTPVTYVPLADFEEDHCESTYNLCYPPEGRRRIFYDVVANINTVVLFSLREGICRALRIILRASTMSPRSPLSCAISPRRGSGKRLKSANLSI